MDLKKPVVIVGQTTQECLDIALMKLDEFRAEARAQKLRADLAITANKSIGNANKTLMEEKEKLLKENQKLQALVRTLDGIIRDKTNVINELKGE